MIPVNYKYKALPKGFKIGKSEIEGQGLFSENLKIKKNVYIGISHIIYNNKIYRTSLGGFINDSDNPNCKITNKESKDKNIYYLKTIRQINKKEEITVDYSKSICGLKTI